MVEVDYISHSVGEMPTNPLMYDDDKWVYCIDSVEEEAAPEEEQSELKHWKFHVNEKLTVSEYIKRQNDEIKLAEDRAVTTAFEATLELIGGN